MSRIHTISPMSKSKLSDVVAPSPKEHDAFVARVSRVFITAAFFVMMSQNTLAPNLTAAAESFGLTPSEVCVCVL